MEVIRRNHSQVKVRIYPHREAACGEATCKATNAMDYFERDIRKTPDLRPRFMRMSLLKEWIEVSEMAALRFRNLGIFYLPS